MRRKAKKKDDKYTRETPSKLILNICLNTISHIQLHSGNTSAALSKSLENPPYGKDLDAAKVTTRAIGEKKPTATKDLDSLESHEAKGTLGCT